ncbi:hypothetical protein B0H10DRAFT_1112904 [Mycena sp. CBHHK59/15]|nr:hypothetical protein B0H10DRAFT_1112904 [Mycena sp. CBHHK59/15]
MINMGTLAPIRSNIQSLALESFWLEDCSLDPLDCLTCPALRALSINSFHTFSPMHFESLLRFLSRSSPPLRECIINSLPLGEAPMVQCLDAMPTLVRLEIGSLTQTIANDIFSRMCDKNTLFLPRLQELRVDVSPDDGSVWAVPWTYDSVVQMLVSRWNSRDTDNISQLQYFGLEFPAPLYGFYDHQGLVLKPDPETLSQFAELIREGMDIELPGCDEDWML